MTPAALIAWVAVTLATIAAADLLATRRRRPRRPRAAGIALIARIGRALGPRAPRSLSDRIAAAGLAAGPADVMAVKAGAATLGFGIAAALAPVAPGRLGLLLLLVVPAAAFLLPDQHVRRRARHRARVMDAELADVLDLLRVAIAAGLAPKRALAEVGRRHPGALAAELRRAAATAGLGVPAARA